MTDEPNWIGRPFNRLVFLLLTAHPMSLRWGQYVEGVFYTGQLDPVSLIQVRGFFFLSKSPSKEMTSPQSVWGWRVYVCVLAGVRVERLKWIPIRSPRTVKHTLSIWFSLSLHLHLARLAWASRLCCFENMLCFHLVRLYSTKKHSFIINHVEDPCDAIKVLSSKKLIFNFFFLW